jgi:hypothetical protein
VTNQVHFVIALKGTSSNLTLSDFYVDYTFQPLKDYYERPSYGIQHRLREGFGAFKIGEEKNLKRFASCAPPSTVQVVIRIPGLTYRSV